MYGCCQLTSSFQVLDNPGIRDDAETKDVLVVIIGRNNTESRLLCLAEVECLEHIIDAILDIVHNEIAIATDNNVRSIFLVDLETPASVGHSTTCWCRGCKYSTSPCRAEGDHWPFPGIAQVVLDSNKVLFSETLSMANKVEEIIHTLDCCCQGIGLDIYSSLMQCLLFQTWLAIQVQDRGRWWSELSKPSLNNSMGSFVGDRRGGVVMADSGLYRSQDVDALATKGAYRMVT